jgi:SAM-dependent methyltransferase
MKRSYWEKIAPSYSDEIFDVLANDKKKIILSAIEKISSRSKTVMDIGCAIGKWLPVLSPLFKKVYAVDISAKNLEIARQLHPGLNNVEYIRVDMSGKKKLPACDAAICINAILTSSIKDRTVFFRSLPACLKKKGQLILTIPSLESWLLTSIIANQWKIDRNLLNVELSPQKAKSKWQHIRQGNADIDNVPTKHYLKEELQLLLTRENLIPEEIHKIEYKWDTEFLKAPKWLKDPKPWDWMVVARKK